MCLATENSKHRWTRTAQRHVSVKGTEIPRISDRGRLSSFKKPEITWKVLSRDLCLARRKLCYTGLHLSQQLPSRFKTNNFCSAPDRPNGFLAGGPYIEPYKEFSGSCQPKKQQDIPSHPTAASAIESKLQKITRRSRTETWIKHDKTIKLS